jgi:Mrp family chromosome partitioning ATPase/capsular polysaccharide biosynthesis protein
MAAARLSSTNDSAQVASYLRATRAHLVVVTLIITAAVGASIAYLAASSPSYKATARLLVNPIDDADAPPLELPLIRNSGDPVRTIQTAAALVKLHRASALLAGRLGSDWTADRVDQAIDVRPEGQSSIVDVTATAASSALAARLANGYVDSVLRVRRRNFQRFGAPALRAAQAQLKRSGDPTSATSLTLQRQISVLQAISGGVDPNLSLAEAAVPSGSAVGPPAWLVVALALLAGVVLAAGTVLLLESVGPARLASEGELLSLYSLPILARVRRIPPTSWRRTPDPTRMDPVDSEAFRTVRVQLELSESQPHALMITSPTRRDGKTFAAAGLALELVGTGATVILVDADVRKPDLHRVLGLEKHPPQPVATAAPGQFQELLELVPGEDGLTLLELERLPDRDRNGGLGGATTSFIKQAIAAADFVIIDTPPLGEVSDALTLVGTVDQVLLVARLNNTRPTSVEVTRDLLERYGVEPGGWIVMDSTDAVRGYPYPRELSRSGFGRRPPA